MKDVTTASISQTHGCYFVSSKPSGFLYLFINLNLKECIKYLTAFKQRKMIFVSSFYKIKFSKFHYFEATLRSLEKGVDILNEKKN